MIRGCRVRLNLSRSGSGTQAEYTNEIAGYDLPAGAGVCAQIIWAHHDPAVFPEPEVFRPERFLERSYSPFEFLPLGDGNRRCILELVSKKPVQVGLQSLPGALVRVIVR